MICEVSFSVETPVPLVQAFHGCLLETQSVDGCPWEVLRPMAEGIGSLAVVGVSAPPFQDCPVDAGGGMDSFVSLHISR